MHIPETVGCYWLEGSSFESQAGLSLNALATELFGREYVGQQTEDFQPRGINRYDMSSQEMCQRWHDQEAIDEWLAKNPDDYGENVWMLTQEGPKVSNVLAHLIINTKLPFGDYLINVDW